MPFLPIFIFDGSKRPKFKRGKVITAKEHCMANSVRNILDAFGFECRMVSKQLSARVIIMFDELFNYFSRPLAGQRLNLPFSTTQVSLMAFCLMMSTASSLGH